MPGIESKQPGDAYRPAIGDERLVIRSGSYTLASEKHPERNEDNLIVNDSGAVYAVFDGMGGHVAGHLASQWAVDSVNRSIGGGLLDSTDSQSLTESMRRVMYDANLYVRAEAGKRTDTHNAGTTGVVARFITQPDGEAVVFIANVGDSRASLLRGGRLYPLTLDDSFAGTLFQDGKDAWKAQEVLDSYDGEEGGLQGISGKYATAFHNRNVVTQALGVNLDSPRIYRYNLQPGDKLILTSDGVGDNLTTDEMATVLNRRAGPNDLSRALCERALDKSRTQSARAKSDDMTAVVVEAANHASSHVQSSHEQRVGTPVSRSAQVAEQYTPRPMGVVVSVDELWDAIKAKAGIEGSREYFSRDVLYRVAADILEGRRPLSAATSGEGFRKAVERVGCREFARNMVSGGHEEVFLGAGLRRGDDRELYGIIDQLGGLVGSRQAYTAEQLKDIARRVLSRQLSVGYATSTQGFRQTLEKMLEEVDGERR